jgi:hypothetical protein
VAYPTWLYVLAWISLGTAAGTAVCLAVRIIFHPEKMAVMNIVWPISALYLGSAAFVLYRLHKVERRSQTHAADEQSESLARLIRPLRLQPAMSVLHCGAGCALGDITGEVLVYFLGVKVLESVFLRNTPQILP